MRIFFGAFVWVIIFINLTVPLAILCLVKLVITQIYCRRFCKRKSSSSSSDFELLPMTIGDCLVTTGSSWQRSAVNIGVVLRVEGIIQVAQLREHFADCFNLNNGEPYSKFFSCIVTRKGYVLRACSRSSLNLSEQIVKRKLRTNRNRHDYSSSADKETLEDFLARWILEDYGEYRPCWEIAVIPVPTTGANSKSKCTAVAFKIHHGLCDGYSLLHIIDKLTGTKSPYLVTEFKDNFYTQIKQTLEAPLNFGRLGGSPPEMNPFRVHLPKVPAPEDERNYEWIFSFTSFSLEDLKTLRRRNGNVHLASIIWTILTGAMRRFLLEEIEMKKIPEYIKVANTLPWPRHPAMSSGTESHEKMCNHWASGLYQVPLREPNPFLRLKEIETEYASFLNLGMDKFASRFMYPLMGMLPGAFLQKLYVKDPGVSNGLTSLVGGDSYSLLGAKVRNVHPLLAMHDVAPYSPLHCFTFSHSGRVELTMGANPRSVIRNRKMLDMICQKFCHDEMEYLLNVETSEIKVT